MAGLLGTQQPERFGLLSPEHARLIQRAASGAMFPPQAPPQAQQPRRRGDPGLLTYLMGGRAGLESERTYRREEDARLEQEAMRPQMEAERRRLQQMAEGFGPEAALAFALNPQEAGKAFASNVEGYTLGAGGMRGGARGTVASAPTFSTVNDQIFRNDPAAGESTAVARADPSFADQTGRINATNPVNVGPGAQLRDPRTGALIATGAPRVFSAADATQLYTEDGGMLAENVRDAPPVAPVDPAEAQRRQAAARGALDTVRRTRAAVQRAVGQVGNFSSGVLAGALPFNQSRANLEATLDTIRANLSFEELSKMRANSPTGGALGGIAVRELDLLGSTVAGLSADQSPQEMRRSLELVDTTYARVEATLKLAAGLELTPAETALFSPEDLRLISAETAASRGGGQQAAPSGGARPRATNPQTGQVVEFDGRSWVPVR